MLRTFLNVPRGSVSTRAAAIGNPTEWIVSSRRRLKIPDPPAYHRLRGTRTDERMTDEDGAAHAEPRHSLASGEQETALRSQQGQNSVTARGFSTVTRDSPRRRLLTDWHDSC